MVFVRQRVNGASQATTQQGLNSGDSLLNLIPTLLLVPLSVKRLSATQEQINMLTGKGVNERMLGFSAEADKSQVQVGSYKGER